MINKILSITIALVLSFCFSSFASEKNESNNSNISIDALSNNEASSVYTELIECYRDAAGDFHVKVGNGICMDDASKYCTYFYIGNGEPGVENDNDPENYEPDLTSKGKRWQPTF